jgi:hypothetical protein
MKKKTKQLVLRLTPELMKMIDEAFFLYLKKTNKYITKAEYIRAILETQCKKATENNNKKDNKNVK